MGVCRGIGRRGSAHGQDRDAVGAWSHHIRHHLCLLGHGDEEVNGSPTFRSSILAVFQFLHLRRSRPPDKSCIQHPASRINSPRCQLPLHLQAELGSHRVGQGRLRKRDLRAVIHARQSRPTPVSDIRHQESRIQHPDSLHPDLRLRRRGPSRLARHPVSCIRHPESCCFSRLVYATIWV